MKLKDQIRLFGRRRRRRRRKIPRQTQPKLIALEYARRIEARVNQLRAELEPTLAEVARLVDAAARERSDTRLDVGEGRRIRALIEEARKRFEESLNTNQIEQLARLFAERTSTHQRIQLNKQVQAALGINALTTDTRLISAMEGFVAENVALIKGVPLDVANQLEKRVMRGVASGKRWKDLVGEVEEEFAVGRRRAKLIARDQVGKFYSQANRVRQTDLGLNQYIWRTVGDQRVRSKHRSRNGKRYSWSDPPSDGHPGDPVRCRCYPEPVFDDLLD